MNFRKHHQPLVTYHDGATRPVSKFFKFFRLSAAIRYLSLLPLRIAFTSRFSCHACYTEFTMLGLSFDASTSFAERFDATFNSGYSRLRLMSRRFPPAEAAYA